MEAKVILEAKAKDEEIAQHQKVEVKLWERKDGVAGHCEEKRFVAGHWSRYAAA